MELSTYTTILILGILSGITTLIGVSIAFYCKKSNILASIGIGFSTGIMVAISVFELLPNAVKATSIIKAGITLVFGFLFILSLHYIIPHSHIIHERGKAGKIEKIALFVAIGNLLHDFPEGFAMANSFIFSPASGLIVAASIAIHNIPEEFAMAMPLVLVRKKWFLIKIAIMSALAEPLGAILGLFAVSLMPLLNPLLMSFAAGAMLFISIDELIPLVRMYKKTEYFIIGAGLSFAVYFGLSMII